MIEITAHADRAIKTAAYFFWQQAALFETSVIG
jgi:hypothetical protein